MGKRLLSKEMKAALCFNSPEMALQLKEQLPDVIIIDAGSNPPIEFAHMRLKENRYWVKNWHEVLTSFHNMGVKYLLMANDDITGMCETKYQNLLQIMKATDAFMVTPSFNSPHQVFHSRGTGFREVNWVDMTCPLVDLDKFWKLGGFDLEFNGYFADIDLCYRARQKGMKMYVADHLKIHHIGGYTVSKEGTWAQSNMEDNQILVKKYGKSWSELI